jgi:hypothetical protein
MTLDDHRRRYAEQIAASAGLKTPGLQQRARDGVP